MPKSLGVSQRRNGSWRAQIRRVGYPYQTKDFKTQREATIWKRSIEAQMDAGTFVSATPAARRMTFGQLIDVYIETRSEKRRKLSSRLPEISRLRAFQRREPDLCEHAIGNLTAAHFEEYRERRLTQKVMRGKPNGRGHSPLPTGFIKPNTVNKELNTLRSALSLGVKQYGLARNVLSADTVKRIAYNDERQVRLSEEEMFSLLLECAASRNIWLAPVVELCNDLGTRRSEILSLRWEDVTIMPHGSTALLRDTKNSSNPDLIRNEKIGLSPRSVEILNNLPGERVGFVIKSSVGAIDSAFKRARLRATLRSFRFHDTRHEFATSRIENGMPEMFVRLQGRWRDARSFLRYVTADAVALSKQLAIHERPSSATNLGAAVPMAVQVRAIELTSPIVGADSDLENSQVD